MSFLAFRPDPDAPSAMSNTSDPEPAPIPFWAKTLTAVVVVGGLFIVLNQDTPKGGIEITPVRRQ
jgi:hypothetical protein